MRVRIILVAASFTVLAGACGAAPELAADPTTTAPVASTTAAPSTTTTPWTTSAAPTTTTTSTAPTTTLPPTSTTTTSVGSAPRLEVTRPSDGDRVDERLFLFEGVVDVGTELVAAGRYPVDVGSDGTWSILLVLNPGGNVATFTATDLVGSTTTARVAVFYDPIVTVADDDSLRPEAFIGQVVVGDAGDQLPEGFTVILGSCIGDAFDDICSHALTIASDGDSQNLAFLERMIGRVDETPEWVIVDALYVAYPDDMGLRLYAECWAEPAQAAPPIHFGVGPDGACRPVEPIRAWHADWRTERITEVPVESTHTCQEICGC